MFKKNYRQSALCFLIAACCLCSSVFFKPDPSSAANIEKSVIRVGLGEIPSTLDPHVNLSLGNIQLNHWIFDPLVRWTADMRMEMRLARNWEQISPTVWRFYLRENVKFHSGNPLTAKDVAWSLKRLRESEEFKAMFEVFDDPVIKDDYTIDLITKRPYSLVANLAAYIFVMDSKYYSGNDEKGNPRDKLSKQETTFAGTHVSGTGPYMPKSFTTGSKLELEAFKGYWTQRGNSAGLSISLRTEPKERVDALLKGDLDFIMPIPIEYYDTIKNSKNSQVLSVEGSCVMILQMNQQRNPIFKDKRVREAIIRGTDNQRIVDSILKNRTLIATQQVPRFMSGYAPSLRPRYNPAIARQLLKDAGYEKGLEFSMIAPDNRYVDSTKIAEAFVDMMADIGIKVNLTTSSTPDYWDKFDAREADIQMIGWQPDTEDAGNYTENLLMCPDTKTGYGIFNSGNYCNPEIDKLALSAQSETDPAKRSRILRNIEQLAYDDAAFVPLHFDPHTWAASVRLTNFDRIVNYNNFPYLGDAILE